MTAAAWRQLNGQPPPGADLVHAPKPTSGAQQPGAKYAENIPEHLRPRRGRMNKTEAAYAQHLHALQLAGQIRSWKFEAITLRLADNTRYTPDFLVEADGLLTLPMRVLEFHEVKGFWRDDAKVKFKVAAELFPMFRFVAVKRKNRQWDLSYPARA